MAKITGFSHVVFDALNFGYSGNSPKFASLNNTLVFFPANGAGTKPAVPA
jgi:hypothetical protein